MLADKSSCNNLSAVFVIATTSQKAVSEDLVNLQMKKGANKMDVSFLIPTVGDLYSAGIVKLAQRIYLVTRCKK